MKLNINNFRNTLKTVLEYLFPVEKVTSYFKSIKSKEDLQKFIQQRSAHVTQTTLYGYLKTRMGHKFTLMVDDEEFSKSINLAKWNIYMVALADCSFYVFSILISEKNLKQNDCREVFLNIIENEKKDPYVNELRRHMKKSDSGAYLLDRLLSGAVIEARGEERFNLLAKNLSDQALRSFYSRISASEARHFCLFLDLADKYFHRKTVEDRL